MSGKWNKDMISLALKRLVFGFLWEFTMSVLLFQRVIFMTISICLMSPFWLLYWIARIHRPLMIVTKLWARFFLWVNGIRVDVPASLLKGLDNTVLWCSYFSAIDYVILFAYVPYESIHYVPKNYFRSSFFRFFAASLGLFEEETHFDFATYQKSNFHADEYAEAGFNLVQLVHVKRQETEPIPYALMIGLKHQLPISFCRLHGSEKAAFASLFSTQRVHFKVHDRLEPSKKVELSLIRYRKILEELRLFERSKRHILTV